MAAPTPSLSTSSLTPNLIPTKNQNLSVTGKNVSTKTAYFKPGTSSNTTDTVMEIITKDSKKIEVSDKIQIDEDSSFYVTQIDKTPVKFASGSPMITQITDVKFPKPEAKLYAPEKVATFLIFKK